jgi:hypothetical protein
VGCASEGSSGKKKKMSKDLVTRISAVALVFGSLSCGSSGNSPTTSSEAGADATTTAEAGTSNGDDASNQNGTADGAAGGVENSTTGCVFPALPDYNGLLVDAKLPDPFMFLDGTRMTATNQWTCRRAEVMAEAEQYELGTKPPKPSMVSGSFANNAITVNVTEAGASGSFTATVQYPTTSSPPYPAMIGIDGIELGPTELQQLGVALITFPASTVAQQDDGSSRGKGVFYDIYGSSASAGAMMAWAWGVSRLIDAIEQTPAAQIDPTRLGVTGCSRDGKGALIVGAFDERIALTVPQESGSGGAASWRISDYQMSTGTVVQTLSEITVENVWFENSFSQFGGASAKLPFDHHMIEGLVAPRALLIVENTSQVWLGNYSTYNNSMAGHLIWDALGIPDRMGVSQVGDHAHCQWNGSQQPEVTAYVQKFLVGGGTADTNILKTDSATYCAQSGQCTAYGFDQARWVNWTVPALDGAPIPYDAGASDTDGGDAASASDADASDALDALDAGATDGEVTRALDAQGEASGADTTDGNTE